MIIQTKKTKEFLQQLQIDSKQQQVNPTLGNSMLRSGSAQGINHNYHIHLNNNNSSVGQNLMVDGVKTVRFPFLLDQNSNLAVRCNSNRSLSNQSISAQSSNIEESIKITLKNVKSAIRPANHDLNFLNTSKSSLKESKPMESHNSSVRSFSPVSTLRQRDYLEKRVEQEATKLVNSFTKKRYAESPLRKLHVPPESLVVLKQQLQCQQQQQQSPHNDQQLHWFPYLKNAVETEQNILQLRGREKQQLISQILESNQSLERLKTKLEEEQKRQIRTARSVERTQNNRRSEREQLARPPSSEQQEFTRLINQFDAEKSASKERLYARIAALPVNQQRQNVWRMHGL